MDPKNGMCRLCLSLDTGKSSRDLFKKDPKGRLKIPYSALIHDILNVLIEAKNKWPQIACECCISFINQVVRYRKRIAETHHKLCKAIRSGIKILDSCCRLCGQSCLGTGIDLFVEVMDDERDQFMSLSFRILDILNVEIEKTKGWPSKSCASCFDELEDIFQFRDKLLESQDRLLNKSLPVAVPKETHSSPTISKDEEAVENPENKTDTEIVLDQDNWDSDVEIIIEAEESLETETVPDSSTATGPVDQEINEIINAANDFLSRKEDDWDFSDLDDDFEWKETPFVDIRPQAEIVRPKEMPITIKKPVGRETADVHKHIRVDGFTKPPRQKERSLKETNDLLNVLISMNILNCQVCGEKFTCLNELKNHVGKNHNWERYEYCCGRKLESSGFMLDHAQLHQDKDAFKCELCGLTYPNHFGLSYHYQQKHSSAFTCELCGFVSGYRNKVVTHIVEKHRPPNYTCDYCGKAFNLFGSLKTHILMMHEKGLRQNYICEICGKMFPTANLVNSHVYYHGGPHGRAKPKKRKLMVSQG